MDPLLSSRLLPREGTGILRDGHDNGVVGELVRRHFLVRSFKAKRSSSVCT